MFNWCSRSVFGCRCWRTEAFVLPPLHQFELHPVSTWTHAHSLAGWWLRWTLSTATTWVGWAGGWCWCHWGVRGGSCTPDLAAHFLCGGGVYNIRARGPVFFGCGWGSLNQGYPKNVPSLLTAAGALSSCCLLHAVPRPCWGSLVGHWYPLYPPGGWTGSLPPVVLVGLMDGLPGVHCGLVVGGPGLLLGGGGGGLRTARWRVSHLGAGVCLSWSGLGSGPGTPGGSGRSLGQLGPWPLCSPFPFGPGPGGCGGQC